MFAGKLLLLVKRKNMVRPFGVYANPRYDIAFKKLFVDKGNENILIDFLNDVLERKNIIKIESVSIADSNNLPLVLSQKTSIVDVRCFDDKKRNYQIEMQLGYQQDYAERCQFYTSYFITKQLEKGNRYKKLEPIIFISVLNFKLFDHDRFLSHHLTTDIQDHRQYLNLIEHHFLELPKFEKNENELKDSIDRWAYFFKNAEKCNQIPSTMADDAIMNEAFDVLKRTNWTPADLDKYFTALDAERSNQSILETTLDKGKREGKIEGRIEEKIEIAKTLLKRHMPLEEIVAITGLSIEEIKKLE